MMTHRLTWHTPIEFDTWCQSLPQGYSVQVKNSSPRFAFTVLDTVDHRLNRFGLCFLRSEAGNALIAAPEFVEVDLALDEPNDISYLQDDMSPDWRDRLFKPLSVRRLLPRGQCEYQSQVYEVRDDWNKWIGDIHEAQWQKGSMELALYRFTPLRGFGELWESMIPKACLTDQHFLTWGQWFELLSAYDEAPLLKPVPNFNPTDSGKSVLSELAGAALTFLSQNEQGVLEQWDMDFLKAHRVVLRRLRAWLAVFKPVMAREDYDAAKELLKAQMTLCSELRDLDVILHRVEQWQSWFDEDMTAGFRALKRRLKRQRSTAYRRLNKQWCSKTYQDELEQIRQLLCQPGASRSVDKLIKKRMKRCFAEVQSRLGEAKRDMQEERVHDLRKAVKKLRYTLLLAEGCHYEFQAPKKMRKVQNMLGEFNDICVQVEWIEKRLQQARLNADERVLMQHLMEKVQERKREIWAEVPTLLDNYVLAPLEQVGRDKKHLSPRAK